MKLNILVTGCGGDIGQSIGKILKSNGMFKNVIGCDMSDENAGKFIFDKVIKMPGCNSEVYIPSLQKILDEEAIDVILPISEAELRMISEKKIESSLLGKPLICANLKALEVGFDKFSTAQFLKESSLPFPETTIVGQVTEPALPVILKSRKGSGSKAVFVLSDIKEFEFYKMKYPDFILQEYLKNDDEEYTCGLFRSSKEDIRTIIYRRKLTGGFSGFGVVVENKEIENLLIKIAAHLNLLGSINVQLRMTANGPYVFEINPRFSSTVKFRHMMGFEDVIWCIQDALGDAVSNYTKPKQGTRFYKGFTEYVD